VLLLDNPIQHYAWGSHTALAQLLGRPVSAQPEAELWIGAHPRAPSRLSDGRSLRDAIRSDPTALLGAEVQQRFGGELPFLLKVLAVDAPLSLQAHPNLEQARAGYAREQLAGVPIDAPERTYKDENHKPELLCALTRFEALSGFRPQEEAAELFASLDLESVDIAGQLRGDAGLRAAFMTLFTLPRERHAEVGAEVVRGCERLAARPGPLAASLRWALDLWQRYPGDIGVAASLLLNHVTLEPLQALYLEAGSLHAYLHGVGVELMASSDNVLRGGLTPKHVDVPELLSILRFESSAPSAAPTRTEPSGEVSYETPAPDFRLSRFELEPAPGVAPLSSGPELLLCTEGQAQIEVPRAGAPGEPAQFHAPRPLRRGQACFIAACSAGYRLSGAGRVFRARVGR
jgi:mannose-6-phosphate isomerase